ncbi:hypothetical protein M408DRAFT_16373 [Serendipita vermifera MAFF 305830]|uniref:Phosphatidic acid phosphatase type 2/haloperoxidase domain-containing protein n=1 Tax=Serendipita vermifera MAFF 305830 TaxID=933852 RepID=A0A0C2XGD9_SERVB|nr:hypothetical protein M408DRAFT_16373 [Serendipita vermifera MAFF 305830]
MNASGPPTSSAIVRKRERRRKLKHWASYGGDWALFLALDQVQGFRRRFSLEDETLQYPFTVHERVPNWLLVVLGFVVPFCLMPIINLISVRSLWDLHNSELGLVLSWALTGSITNILKVTTGRPRPDLIDRCTPKPGAHNPPIFGLVDWTICTQTDESIMRDGWRSFISGHSSLSFAGLGYLTFYLAGKLHLFDERGYTAKAWISPLPIFGATVIAITRTMDYRHHSHDVVVGMLLGISIAYFSYRQYYPSLAHPLSHRPFAPRYEPHERPTASGDLLNMDDTPEPSQRGRGRGLDAEAAHEDNASDNEELDHEMEGTLPRSKPFSLSELWKASAQRLHVPSVIAGDS